jgi:hypothetical protein
MRARLSDRNVWVPFKRFAVYLTIDKEQEIFLRRFMRLSDAMVLVDHLNNYKGFVAGAVDTKAMMMGVPQEILDD